MKLFQLYKTTCQYCHHPLRGNYDCCYKCDQGNSIFWQATVLCYVGLMVALWVIGMLMERGWDFNPFL